MGSLIISAVFLVAGLLMWFALKPLRKVRSDDVNKTVGVDERILTLLESSKSLERRIEQLESNAKKKTKSASK